MVSVFNFAHVSCLFLAKNYSKLNKGRDVHNKNFSNLVLESRCECNHPDKVIFNYSLYKTVWKVSKYGVISGPYFPVFSPITGKYGLEITPYLGTFHVAKLPELEKRLLANVLNHAFPTIKLNYGNYMTPFELFYRDMRRLPIEDHVLEKVKTEILKQSLRGVPYKRCSWKFRKIYWKTLAPESLF